MRVVLFGYQTWGHSLLQTLLDSRHEVVLVVTHPDGDDAYEAIWSDSVAALAEQHGLELVYRDKAVDDELVEHLHAVDADIIVATNWRSWIAPKVFNAPRLGTLNTHDALLPRYGGFAPLNWALINGEPEVGVTAHVMDEQLDGGPIVGQARVPVEPTDTTATLFHKTLAVWGPLTLDALDRIESGTGERIAQDPEQATFFHKRADEDNRIDWRWPAQDLVNLVRAQTDPYPNAFCFHGDQRLGIVAASVSRRRAGGTPGRIFHLEGDGVVIVCGPDAQRGRNHGLVIERLRTAAGHVLTGREHFTRMGGYLTSHPAA